MLHAFMCAHDSLPKSGPWPRLPNKMASARAKSVFKRSGYRFALGKRVKPESGSTRCDGGCVGAAVRAISAARVGGAIDFQQPFAVDAGVDLGGRRRSVTEKDMNSARLAAAAQKIRGKAM